MNFGSFCDKRRNKRLRASYEEIRKSLTVDEWHGTMDDFVHEQIFPNEYSAFKLAIASPTEQGRKRL